MRNKIKLYFYTSNKIKLYFNTSNKNKLYFYTSNKNKLYFYMSNKNKLYFYTSNKNKLYFYTSNTIFGQLLANITQSPPSPQPIKKILQIFDKVHDKKIQYQSYLKN